MPLKGADYPHWADVLVRTLRTISYLSGVALGIGGSFFLSSPVYQVSTVFVIACSATVLISSALCAIANALKRWMVEWVSLFFLSAAFSIYAVSVWFKVPTSLGQLTGAGGFTMLSLLLVLRLVDLTVFYIKYVRVARIQKRVLKNVS